jgi:hypothetical protein
MPTDLPPPRKPHHDVTIPVGWTNDRMLNWMAVAVGVGLCFWALNTDVISLRRSHDPGVSAAPSALGDHPSPSSRDGETILMPSRS